MVVTVAIEQPLSLSTRLTASTATAAATAPISGYAVMLMT